MAGSSQRIEQLKAIVEGADSSEATARIGLNRGQFFVRFPKEISDNFSFEKGQQVKLSVERKGDSDCLVIERLDGA